MHMCESLDVECVLRNKMIGSEGMCNFHMASYFRIGLQSDRTSSYSQQCGRLLISPTLVLYLILVQLNSFANLGLNGLTFYFTFPMLPVSLVIFPLFVAPLGFHTSVRCFFISFASFHIEFFFLIWELSTYYGYYPVLVICLGDTFSQSVIYISTWLLGLPQGQRYSLLSKCLKICILYLVLDFALIFVSFYI